VFRGWDPKLERPVALKTIHLEQTGPVAAPGDDEPTLLREAVTLARLNHPNIVSVYDVEDADQVALIAMEFVDGMNLETLIARSRTLRPESAVPLIAAVARGDCQERACSRTRRAFRALPQ